MPVIGGWSMPEADKYFHKFIPEHGPLPKQNGFERHHLMAALAYVRDWTVAMDVGAHVGFWTRDMAERFAMVYAFEAAPDTYECLKTNTDDLLNVVALHRAVGDSERKCSIAYDKRREKAGNTGSRFVSPDAGGITMISLDSMKLTSCGFIKIDVEGFEYYVLRGAHRTIARHRPVIIMECRPWGDRFPVPDGSAETCLLGFGYKEVEHLGRDKVFVPV